MTRSEPLHWTLIGRILALGALVFLLGGSSLERLAIPSVELKSPRFAQFGAGPDVDHAPWDAFLSKYHSVDSEGVARLAYADITSADRAALDAYVDALEATDVSQLSRDMALAYWINAYNAVTVQVVLDDYPVDTIRDITDGFLSFGPWNRELFVQGGDELSLNDIEHKIIRPVFDEPRIHYAVNCAAYSCPNLAKKAWRAETLERDLAAAERAYVNDPRGVSVDGRGRVTVSKIYNWFREDFGDNEDAILSQLIRAAEPALRAKLEARGEIDDYEYDWALNDAKLATQ